MRCSEGCTSFDEVGEVLAKGLWESRAGGMWVSAESQAEPLREAVYTEVQDLDIDPLESV